MTNNREIKFRGMSTKKRVWVYGIYDPYKYRIGSYLREFLQIEPFWHYVDPKTVGQYTGLKDKNGKEVFEGDILKTDKFIGVIEYNDIVAALVVKINDSTDNYYHWSFLNEGDITRNSQLQYTERIGNIYENPELLDESLKEHARWEKTSNPWHENEQFYKCSNCDWRCSCDDDLDYNYCPNCGAKMDLEEK